MRMRSGAKAGVAREILDLQKLLGALRADLALAEQAEEIEGRRAVPILPAEAEGQDRVDRRQRRAPRPW